MTPARAVFDRMSEPMGWRTDTEVMATTRPHPRSHMAGTTARHMATVDSRFSSSAGAYASSGVVANVPGGGPPALGTRMSTCPSASAAASTKPVAPSVVDTSATIGTARSTPPAAASMRSRSRPQMATRAPSAASARAAASPRPDDAPATAAVRPAMPRSMA